MTLTDNRDRNALRMVISQKVLRAISPRLSDMVLVTLVSDSLRLKIEDRLVIQETRPERGNCGKERRMKMQMIPVS